MEVCEASYQIITDLLAARTGQHLTESRRWRVESALAGLFQEHGISNLDQLACMLGSPRQRFADDDLASQVVEALLNNETYFFRDKPTFDQIPKAILPEIAARRALTKRLSIWCAGCSTGQEVHSLAMMFDDQKDRWRGWTIDILGTDVSHDAVRTAQSGLYNQFEVQRGLGIADILRHFDETSGGWKIQSRIREMVRFQQHNLLTSPPARQNFDLILCRNVLLYFDTPTRETAFRRLSSVLAPDGYLMLGAGETVVGHSQDFVRSAERTSLFELQATRAAIAEPAFG